MNLKLKRLYKKPTYTIGKLYIDDVYFADTIEDKDRGLTSNMTEEQIKSIKIKNETAIPTGTYQIDMNSVSPKFGSTSWAKPYGGKVPRLIGIKGFDGVLIHLTGNTSKDTSGCILVGKNNVVGMITQSRDYVSKLYQILFSICKKEKVYITIE